MSEGGKKSTARRKVRGLGAGSGPSLAGRFAAFATETDPFVACRVVSIFEKVLESTGGDPGRSADGIDALRKPFRAALEEGLSLAPPGGVKETTPGVTAKERCAGALDRLAGALDGFLRREAIAASFSEDERRELLRGMILTRATDNALKRFFACSEVRYGTKAFQGKGFRSLGQEAIYGAPLRLRRGEAYRRDDGSWGGDVVAPLIRDLGAALAMHPEAETVRMTLSAQMGKIGPPMEGRDFHVGDFSRGILPATAPLSIGSLTSAGLAMGFRLEGSDRVAVTFIGEGGSSLGEWHEAINLCAARRLPAIFCIENNQTALSTPVEQQSAARLFADKAAGYGVPATTLDGTDPEAIAAGFAWAAERARAGLGPTLIELIAMRMCGHAHHDDMLYLGKDPKPSWTYPEVTGAGYADRDLYAYWAKRDPIQTYAAKLRREGVIGARDVEKMKREAEKIVEREAHSVIAAPWPEADDVAKGVYAEPAAGSDRTANGGRGEGTDADTLPPLEPGPPFTSKGTTFLEAIMLGVGDALEGDDRVFVYGQDVGGKYGNAFMLLRPLLEKHGERLINSTLAEGGVLGVCVGAALAGRRPIGEIQFNDFVATGFNQLVNNAAKTRYRWGAEVPMVVRMPWGGLRSAGPYHSQNTEAWFYRTPGLKIVVPSTPYDARALFASAMADHDPVLFYEHIALYRDPSIRQEIGDEPPRPIPLGKAALRRAGSEIAIITYGAYVHIAMKAAEKLARDGHEAAILDLRSLSPLDRGALLAAARHTGKVLIVHEDSKRGGIGESLAAIIQEEAFDYLDAPVRVIGALDTPVPYSPPLEEAFLPSAEKIERAARELCAY